MYQIAICDDEKIFTDKLAHMIKQYSNAHHHVIDLHLFQQAADFIQSSLESYDIVFLDVRFGEISGIEVAKALRAKNENAILIFVSWVILYMHRHIFSKVTWMELLKVAWMRSSHKLALRRFQSVCHMNM